MIIFDTPNYSKVAFDPYDVCYVEQISYSSCRVYFQANKVPFTCVSGKIEDVINKLQEDEIEDRDLGIVAPTEPVEPVELAPAPTEEIPF